MRLTRETLIKIARDTASQRARVSRRIICIYLTGSVLYDSPLLGGTTDIDLVIIHDSDPLQAREVVRLTDEIHLDISHYAQSVFYQPRHLRADPWLGPFIYSKPLVLHDTQHWFDFAQAAAGAQFMQPDYILQRANTLAQAARQSWMEMETKPGQTYPRQLYQYLKVLENAGNALASLAGEPLTERRFLLNLHQRLQSLHHIDLTTGLTQLFTANSAEIEPAWPNWMQAWQSAYQAAGEQEDIPVRLQACRKPYYTRAAAALWEENPTAAIWLLLRTWTLATSHLPDGCEELAVWEAAMSHLHLDSTHFPARLQELDRYLDQVEETLDIWGRANGVSNLAEI